MIFDQIDIHSSLFMTPDDRKVGKIHSALGNLAFGGLPHNCGPETAVRHLESLVALGDVIAKQDLMERSLTEFVKERDDMYAANNAVLEAMQRVADRPIQSTKAPGAFPLASFLEGHLTDDCLDVAFEFGIVHETDRPEAFAELSQFLLEHCSTSAVALFSALDDRERRRWSIPAELDHHHRRRVDNISVDALLLGLHELSRLPWRHTGGLVAGRGATSEYLSALKKLNRDVVIAYILHEWHWSLSDHVEGMGEKLDSLIDMSVSFALPRHIEQLLHQVTYQFMHWRFAVAIILARSAIEATLKLVRERSGEETLNAARLVDLIGTLQEAGILSAQGAIAARDVQTRGNKAVHEGLQEMNHEEVAEKTLRSLVMVLKEVRPFLEMSEPNA